MVPHMADANYDELWLHKQLPFLEDHDHSISFAELRPAVSVADSRRLVVSLAWPYYQLLFCSAACTLSKPAQQHCRG